MWSLGTVLEVGRQEWDLEDCSLACVGEVSQTLPIMASVPHFPISLLMSLPIIL